MPRGVYQRGPSRAKPKVVRTWTPGDPIPDGEPSRYPDRDGYVRLRWKVGVMEYVEAREHRFLTATEPGRHVHHRNGTKGDNRPVNLARLGASEHAQLHGLARRRFNRTVAIEMYESGMSTPAIGRALGVDPSNIWRGLHREGYVMRPRPGLVQSEQPV